MAVVGAEDEVARIEAALRHRLDLRRDVVPGGAESQHRAHALPHPRHSIDRARALMIVRRAAGGIGMEGRTEVGRA